MDAAEYRQFAKKHAHLRANNVTATCILLLELALTAFAIFLSLSNNTFVWIAGQILFAISTLHWFVLVHDCSHWYFFTSLRANRIAGHLASIFCILPFMPWQHIHSRHHVWTGWQDLDPTQQSMVRETLPRSQKRVVDFCWRFWIPLFGLAYSFENFWNLRRLYKMFPQKKRKIENTFSVVLFFVVYGVLIWAVGGVLFLKTWGLGYLLFLVISDPLLLSQHAHIPQNLAKEKRVNANKLSEQDEFTRTLVFPKWVSRFILLHFDAHIVHHLLPNLPCYRLGEVELHSKNKIKWFLWLRMAKKMPAHQLLFLNSRETGIQI